MLIAELCQTRLTRFINFTVDQTFLSEMQLHRFAFLLTLCCGVFFVKALVGVVRKIVLLAFDHLNFVWHVRTCKGVVATLKREIVNSNQ